jgi:hypothetical protein
MAVPSVLVVLSVLVVPWGRVVSSVVRSPSDLGVPVGMVVASGVKVPFLLRVSSDEVLCAPAG